MEKGTGRKFDEIGRRIELPPDQVAAVRKLLGDRQTYFDGGSLCIFEPGIKLIVRRGTEAPFEWSLCLKCADIEVERDGKPIGFASFLNGRTKAVALATFLFPDDKDLTSFIAEEEASAKKYASDAEKWLAAMPKPLRPFWNQEMRTGSPIPDKKPLSRALAKGIPEVPARILALLTWYGSGAGPWTGFPAYEEIADELLLEFRTDEIVAASESTQLTETQTEGAARFFGGWTFSNKRPEDLKKLPAALKQTLLLHTMKSPHEANRDYAKKSFR